MYLIADYEKDYNPTNSSGGELKTATYVKMPVKPRGKGLRALLKMPKGLEIFGIWGLLLQAATETTTPSLRGKLLNHKDEPATVQEIASAISLDRHVSKVHKALDILVDLGWVEYRPSTDGVRSDSVQDTDSISPKISKDKISKDKGVEVFPKCLQNKEFETAWSEWVQYRIEKRQKLTPTTIKRQIKQLAKHPKQAVAILNKSMEKGWLGLFFPDEKPTVPEQKHKCFRDGKLSTKPIRRTGVLKYICDKCDGLLESAPPTKSIKGKIIPKRLMGFDQLEKLIEKEKAKKGKR